MNYNLLVCAADKQWTAIDVNADGDCDRISIEGNQAMSVESNEAVSEFCAQILNYYNIEKFSDIELNIKIVVISEYSSLISDLFLRMKDAKSVNVTDAKSIIPVYVLKKCIVKPDSVIDVRCFEKKFTLQVDNDLLVSYTDGKAGEEIVMEPEDFSILFRFDCRNLISDKSNDESELKELEERCNKEVKSKQKKIDEHKKKYDELKKKYDEIEACYTQLQKEVEEIRTKFEILRFDKNQLKKTEKTEKNYSFISSTIAAITDSCMHDYKHDYKYKCKLLKADGEIVKKGTNLIEVVEYILYSDHTTTNTGKKCIIKAGTDGRVRYFVENDDVIQDNCAVGVLCSPILQIKDGYNAVV